MTGCLEGNLKWLKIPAKTTQKCSQASAVNGIKEKKRCTKVNNMANKLKVKKGDEVVVIAGKDKGKKGKITKVIPETRRVVVGGRQHGEAPQQTLARRRRRHCRERASLHVSNVMLVDGKSGKGTASAIKSENGNKVRISRRSGEKVG